MCGNSYITKEEWAKRVKLPEGISPECTKVGELVMVEDMIIEHNGNTMRISKEAWDAFEEFYKPHGVPVKESYTFRILDFSKNGNKGTGAEEVSDL